MTDLLYDPDTISGEWAHLAYSAERTPAPDAATYNLAHLALNALTESERDVVELLYGFRGSVKSLAEVASVRRRQRSTIQSLHDRAMLKMRAALHTDLLAAA